MAIRKGKWEGDKGKVRQIPDARLGNLARACLKVKNIPEFYSSMESSVIHEASG